MEKNQFADDEINETNLEFDLFNNLDEYDGDAVSLFFKGQKNRVLNEAKSAGEIESINPFLLQRFYVNTDSRIILYPGLKETPNGLMDVTIKGCKSVFDCNCAIVLCEKDGKDFVYFDSDTKLDLPSLTRQNRLGSKLKVSIYYQLKECKLCLFLLLFLLLLFLLLLENARSLVIACLDLEIKSQML